MKCRKCKSKMIQITIVDIYNKRVEAAVCPHCGRTHSRQNLIIDMREDNVLNVS